jgi:hypothetical protein
MLTWEETEEEMCISSDTFIQGVKHPRNQRMRKTVSSQNR